MRRNLKGLLPVLLVAGLVPACAPAGGREEKKVSGTFCRNGPSGALHKRFLTPFSPAAVSVLVLDGRTDRALPGAAVTAARGARSFAVAAGQDGVAVAQGLEAGDWLFTASAPGYQPMAGTVAVDPAKTGKYTLAIKLAPEEAAGGKP